MERETLTRRRFVGTVAAFTAGCLVASCRPAAPTETPKLSEPTKAAEQPTAVPTPAPAQKVTIEWWYGWGCEACVKTLDAVVAKFQEANPEITVKSGVHEWGEKLLTAYAAGTPPDIHEHWLPMEFAARGLVYPLDDRVAASKVVSVDLFPSAAWGVGTWNGKRYCLPALAFFAELALIVNPAAFKNVGLESPRDVPKTYDQAFQQARQYTTTDSAGNLEMVWWTPDPSLRYLPTLFGLTAYDQAEHRWQFDQPGWPEAVESTARFYKDFGPEKIDAFKQNFPGFAGGAPGSAFASDKLAMYTSGYWEPGDMDINAPGKEVHYTWAPTGGAATGKKVTHWGAHSVMIPVKTKYPDEAWRLAEFLDTVEASKIIYDGLAWIGPSREFWAVLDTSTHKGMDFFVEEVARKAEVNTANPPSPSLAFALTSFSKDVVDAVIYGTKTAKEALEGFQKAAMEEESRLSKGS